MVDAPPETIDAVVWDIGGVLLEWDPRHLYRTLFDDTDEMDRFLERICTPQWHEALDLGIPYEQACGELAQRYPAYEEMIWAWGRRREEMIVGPIEESVALLRAVKHRGVRCYALTNMEPDTYPARAARYEFFSWFDGTVVSSLEGLVKPNPEIFRRLLDRFELGASTTLMIDDSVRNIETARSLGMQTVHFRSAAQLRTALEQLRLL